MTRRVKTITHYSTTHFRRVRNFSFKTTDEAKQVLKEKADSFFQWLHPELPEDLCFFKDGEAWLSSSSELKELYIYPTSVDETHAIKAIEGLEVLEIEF